MKLYEKIRGRLRGCWIPFDDLVTGGTSPSSVVRALHRINARERFMRRCRNCGMSAATRVRPYVAECVHCGANVVEVTCAHE